ncbi:FeoB-associated Cys-rich membrane protein [Desulfotignum balticum]|uniref:FeoB-associated Cys-rich membrane protein n=1 Tax=Desulfotignum balticum TaxID=115781 RepID=UPI00040CF800|nr:FeoB-associated Cys-rich membrane protein [Desulfotignum balticum]
MFEKILIGLIVAGAVYYLYRRFRATTSADGASCGCGGCDSCGTARIACESNGSKQEKK